MNFPDTDTFILENEERKFELLNVIMLSGDDEEIDDNLTSWTVKSVKSELINVKLEFRSPLEVSQGDYPDKIVIQAGLSDY